MAGSWGSQVVTAKQERPFSIATLSMSKELPNEINKVNIISTYWNIIPVPILLSSLPECISHLALKGKGSADSKAVYCEVRMQTWTMMSAFQTMMSHLSDGGEHR